MASDPAVSVPVLLGPTGAGKTDLLNELDPDQVEIISCDSRQVYRELEIGSAAPDARLLERLPHHLVGFLSPSETINAALFRREALAAIAGVFARGRIPFLVGGSGFYFQALRTGLFAVDVSPEIRSLVAGLEPADRLARLRELDPAALVPVGEHARAGRVHPNDQYRVGRALEICLASGRTFSGLWAERLEQPVQEDRYHFIGWRLECEAGEYWKRLEARARWMVATGIVEEAGRVFAKYGPCPGLATLGYVDALAAWRGEISRSELAERLFISHRQYGKRQRTWLRRETALESVDRAQITAKIRDFLQSRTRS
jgi:tRNA dimethylallyltransferase